MGKILKTGFDFMARVNGCLIRKIDDIPKLKEALITLGEEKTHLQMSHYALLLAAHLLEFSGIERSPEIDAAFTVNERWQKREAKFQEGRDAAGVLHDLARAEKDPVKVKVLRAMGQVAATPHVRWHALAASEYAVVVVNLLHPGDMEKVRQEREVQIALMKSL